MADYTQVKNTVIELLAAVTKRSTDEISDNLNADFTNMFHLSSLEYFPLLSSLEEQLNVELDYAEFLTEVHTANEAIDYVAKIAQQQTAKS